MRTRPELHRVLDGYLARFEDPGLVLATRWHPDGTGPHPEDGERAAVLAGVIAKPATAGPDGGRPHPHPECSRDGTFFVSMPIYCAGMSLNLRSSARAIILDGNDRILLCRFVFPHPAVPGPELVVWAAPGGGIEPGEDRLAALRRELREETGLAIATDPPHVWRQVVVAAGHAPGYDGVINDYFLVRTSHFEPRGELTDDQLAGAENLTAFRWWRLPEIAGYTGTDLFSPRDLATPLAELLSAGAPAEPTRLGLERRARLRCPG